MPSYGFKAIARMPLTLLHAPFMPHRRLSGDGQDGRV